MSASAHSRFRAYQSGCSSLHGAVVAELGHDLAGLGRFELVDLRESSDRRLELRAQIQLSRRALVVLMFDELGARNQTQARVALEPRLFDLFDRHAGNVADIAAVGLVVDEPAQ